MALRFLIDLTRLEAADRAPPGELVDPHARSSTEGLSLDFGP